MINLHPATVIRLAIDLIGSELAVSGRTLASRDALELAIQSAWNELPHDGYLRRLHRTDELSAAVLESILALRMSGVETADIDARMENAAKSKDLTVLATSYCKFLECQLLVDSAEVLKQAIARLGADPLAFGPDTLILVPDGFTPSGLEGAFLAAVPATHRRNIVHPLEASEPRPTDIRLLAHLGQGSLAAAPSLDNSVQFFRAVGEVNEIREVLRRCLAVGLPLDDVEVLHSDAATYIPLIYSLARRHASKEYPDGIPATFAEGIPASLSRPGRAMASWLLWITEGFPQRLLVELIGEGLLDCGDEELGFGFLTRLLRPLAIGSGAANYLPKLDEQIKATKGSSSSHDEGDGESARAQAHDRALKGLKHLRKMVANLLKLSQSVLSGTGPAIIESAETFLAKWARSINELDEYASEALLGRLKERKFWLDRLNPTPNLKWFLDLPAQTPILGSSPRPGHLHVAHLGSGGQSGRGHTVVVGLDDRRFPGAGLQDPILLDSERKSLNLQFQTSAERLHERLASFSRTLSRLKGRVTISWPSQDLADDRDVFPSSVVLSAYRVVSGRAETDLDSLNSAVGPPVSFAPTAPEKALDESERWLWWLTRDERSQGASQIASVEARFPHLARGNLADRERSTDFGQYSGHVPLAGKALNPFLADAQVLSASALETAGRCPLAFFFRNGLGIQPPDEMQVDEDRWLDPAQFGQLLHETFRQFMEQLTGNGKLPDFERDNKLLGQVLAERMKQWREDRPPPNENAFRVQSWQLVRIARIFLQAEEEYCRSSQPRFFEVSLGLEGVGKGTVLDTKDPTTILLPGGRSIRVRGRVDRVDQSEATRFSVWDYKTGSAHGYSQVDPFNQGRRVQNAIYVRMVEASLRQHLDPNATVAGFGYFFPTVRAHGLRIQWDAQSLVSGLALVEKLCASIADGAFPATNKKDDCTFCDYATICRDVDRVTCDSEAFLARPELQQLKYFRELRGG